MKKLFRTIIFYCLFPLLLFLGMVWWKRDSHFIISQIKMFFIGEGL